MQSVLKHHTILYVEDEPEIQANMAEYLESYFSKVYVASDGKEALELYEKHHPDVLLLDINLPFMDGLSVATSIRKQDKDVKIVMLTAHTEKDKLLLATELKLTKYLVKPIAPKLFKETMEVLANDLLVSSSNFVHLSENCVWDKKYERLCINGTPVSLSQKEQSLLKLFIERKDSTVSNEDIMIAVWEDAYERDISIDSVKNQVSLLRKKLPDGCLKSVYGSGYTLS